MRKYLVVLFIVVLFSSACGPSAEEIAAAVSETRASEPSPTAVLVTVIHTAVSEVPVTIEVTREVEVTEEVEVTRVVEVPVTVTFTATPVNSPTPSNTPTVTPPTMSTTRMKSPAMASPFTNFIAPPMAP